MIKKRKALLIDGYIELRMPLPDLLARAGFEVDLMAIPSSIKINKSVKNFEIFQNFSEILKKLSEKNLDDYDFIIVCDDNSLRLILESDLPLERKLKILPVKNEKDFLHIFSKVGLSKVFAQENILTPEFVIAENFTQAVDGANKIGYPILLKIDSSAGGRGVFECKNFSDLNRLNPEIFKSSLVIQKKINGREIDVSAIYRDEKLIHFCYAKVEKVVLNKFGPSVLRTYFQLGNFEERLFLEMTRIGKALGSNGFVNFSCMESYEDGKRYFFEADMRPNAWADFTKFIGDDAAPKIAKWFSCGEKMSYPFVINKNYPLQKRMAYFNRMCFWEVFCNRYGVWKFMSRENFEVFFGRFYCEIILQKIYRGIKRSPTNLIRLFFPRKEHRARIRMGIKRPYFLMRNLLKV